MPVFIQVIFVLVVFLLIFNIFKSLNEYFKNNEAPIITEEVLIKDKRQEYTTHAHQHGASTYTTYYVTFEFVDGERLELKIPLKQYKLMAINDQGNLTYQRKRFKQFIRTN